jgi:RNA polymerase sigma-54 factor
MNHSTSLAVKQKQNMQLSLRMWLPLLQAPLQELDTLLEQHSYENPFLEHTSSFEISDWARNDGNSDSKQGFIENASIYKESLYDKLLDQICEPLFPTPKSQKIALEILQHIESDGYFTGDIEQIAILCNTTNDFVETIRKRFGYLEPYGVGAMNNEESFLFQLEAMEMPSGVHELACTLVRDLGHIDKYHKHHFFDEAMHIVKMLNHPPAIDYIDDEPYIIPDFFVEIDDDVVIKINNEYYPDIEIKDPFLAKNSELRSKLKEAKDLVSLLELRKATLYKLVICIVDKQMRFFMGGELKPLTMSDIALELGFEESTISRAVSNKYLQCERGTLSLKSFFTNAITHNLSSSEIKNYVKALVDNEPHDAPLTDDEIMSKVTQKYGISMVRRTITKYRKLLDIPSSKERKKLYTFS